MTAELTSSHAARLELQTPLTHVRLVPAEGGRVEAVVDRRTGRNLLAVYGDGGEREDWYAGSPGGWDEMFPNDDAWNGHPAHGRVWSQAFRVVKHEAGVAVLEAELSSPAVTIRRTYRVLDDPEPGLRIDTDLTAHAPSGPFLWSSHPMLAVEPGWRVSIDPSAFEVDQAMRGRFGPGEKDCRTDTADLGVPDRDLGWGEVLYLSGLDRAAVCSPSGAVGTRVSWDPTFFSQLWIVTVSGFDGFDLGFLFEPSTSRPFRLAEAVDRGTARSLEAGERIQFWSQVQSLDRPEEAQGAHSA